MPSECWSSSSNGVLNECLLFGLLYSGTGRAQLESPTRNTFIPRLVQEDAGVRLELDIGAGNDAVVPRDDQL